MASYRHIAEGWTARLRFAADDRLMSFVRRGDSTAFEILYDRHANELLSFCVYMLGSRQDAEDAVQATFASAYRALNADTRDVVLRPWLFTIARNNCLSILRRRRPVVELEEEQALTGDPVAELELREELRHMLKSLLALPERQRAALVLAELHGLSQGEIGTVLGVQAEQVKAYVYQARSNLISDREAREADCVEIREELAAARGAQLLKSRLRRHVRACAGCRTYADSVARQRRQLGLLLPVVPSLTLKYRVFEHAIGLASLPGPRASGAAVGASAAGAAVELAGGGAKALVAKVATGLAVLGAGAGAGAAVLGIPLTEGGQAPSTSASGRPAALQAGAPAGSRSKLVASAGTSRGGSADNPVTATDGQGSQLPARALIRQSQAVRGGSAPYRATWDRGDVGTGPPGSAEKAHGGSQPEHPGQTTQRRHSHEEHHQAREERLHGREERRKLHEERLKKREELRHTAPPPLTEEERRLKREERLKRREELKHGGGAPPPLTEEERRIRQEEHRRKREEREAKHPPPERK
jgi:RNA polymerase sigma factor (sigma-70 family)